MLGQPQLGQLQKLTCLIQYLQETAYMVLVLHKDESECIQSWIDVSFAIHPNMHGHTGAMMSMGSGLYLADHGSKDWSLKAQLKLRWLVSMTHYAKCCGLRNSLRSKGVHIKETMVYQDNTSSILLENNRKQSSTKHTKHMDIHYFDITDYVKNKGISIHHCNHRYDCRLFYKNLSKVLLPFL